MNSRLWNRNFTLLTLSNFLMCSAYYSLISTLPIYISTELHAVKSTVGLVLASYIVAAVMIRPFAGFALDKLGRRSIFIAGLFLYALIFGGYLVTYTILIMTIVRFSHGMTWGVTTTSNSTVAIDIIPPEKRGEGIGYFGVSTTLGMALGPVIGAFIVHHGGYHAMFLGGCAISLASMGFAAAIHYPPYVSNMEKSHFHWNSLIEPTTILPSLNLILVMIAYGGLLSFIALYAVETGIHNPSGFFLVYAAGIILSRLMSGKRFDKSGPKKIIILGLAMLVAGFPVLALMKNPAGFYGSAIILGYGHGVVFPTFQAMANNTVPAYRRGAANSTLFTALDIGMGLGMVIAGVLSQHFSISVAFLVCSGICAAALIFFLALTLDHYWKHLQSGPAMAFEREFVAASTYAACRNELRND